ncbi:MAG: hypothetical protein OXC19_08335 [Bryobacterales bacterium]|nr:hypothetical protein [Bryobacterales bacterium]
MLNDCRIAAVLHDFQSFVPRLGSQKADHLGEVIKAVLDNVVQNMVEAMYARPHLFERLR